MNCNYQKRLQSISSNLSIANVDFMKEEATKSVAAPQKINHIFCCDVSGSMTSTLPKMRNQLKNKLPNLVGPNDTITIIWFSGSKECGVLKEFASVKSPKDLQLLNEAIDRFLVPLGLTSFYEPIELASRLTKGIQKNSGLFNFIFMSDGGNNDHPWNEVMSVVESLNGVVAKCTVIEYGNWADTDKLQQIAETIGGERIYAEDFDDYEFVFEKAITGKDVSPRKEVSIADFKSSAYSQTFVEINDVTKSINVYDARNSSSIYLPITTDSIFYLMKGTDGTVPANGEVMPRELYALMWVALSKNQISLFEKLLKSSEDLRFTRMYLEAFGKQRIESLKDEIYEAVFDESLRAKEGLVTSSTKLSTNGYCILDLMEDLSDSDKNEILVLDPRFSYHRIGAKSKTKIVLSDDVKDALSTVTTKLKADKILEDAEKSQKVNVLYPDKSIGFSIRNLVWSEDRANLSFMVKIPVTLELPENEFGITTVDSYIFRNFTIIKDGILNITQLPMHLTDEVRKKLSRRNLIVESENGNSGRVDVVDLSRIPIVNRDRTKSVKMKTLADLESKLLEYRAYKKYLSWLKKSDVYLGFLSNKTTTPEDDYLSSLGITGTGYNPSSEKDYTGDSYMALTLKSTISKFSSLPKIEDVISKIKDNKNLTVSQEFMKEVMDDIDQRVNTSEDAPYYVINSLYDLYDEYTKDTIRSIAQYKFSLIMSKRWFCDKENYEDNTEVVKIGDTEQTLKYEFRDQKIPM